ncbi:MAG: (4Fe-4S)-binding protein [Ardenticatenia bacterium]|nr:MAG: (4Fe-4S)-binding protein [Ardenticatenia bacterium]
MRIAVASGKGGTGKTTIATSLALAVEGRLVLFLDCDVEAPNAHLTLKPNFVLHQPVHRLVPRVDEVRCTGCGHCAEVCRYHAIAVIGSKVLVFPELCHGCGSCVTNCPEAALSEYGRLLGVLEAGSTPTGITFIRGVLEIGEPSATPVIRQLKKWAVTPEICPQVSTSETVEIRDAPPGTSCPVVETLRGADFALLVSEPTPFGLHDLRLIVELVREMNIPAGVVVNRDMTSDGMLERFCVDAELPILMRIPLERDIGQALAAGKPLITVRPAYTAAFRDLFERIQQLESRSIVV